MKAKEAIVAYLYDEIDAVERNRIEAHLARCSECRAEVNALRAVRIELPAWAPPERDLGFTIADRAQTAAPPRRWIMPAWDSPPQRRSFLRRQPRSRTSR